MTALAITREGRGVLYRFETKQAAHLHPLVQWGDPVWDYPQDVVDEYRSDEELAALAARADESGSLGDRITSRRQTLRDVGKTIRQARDIIVYEGIADDLWRALVHNARVPPDDPETVLAMIREDRQYTLNKDTRTMAKKDTAVAGAEAPVKEKKVREPKAPKAEKDVNGLPLTTKLTFGVAPASKDDKGVEVPGKEYHPEKNNPKRATSKSAERFKLYRKNITIAQAIEAGMSAGNVAHDLEKGYVVVVPGKVN